jgi:site-specific DNA recombinase
MQQPGPKSKCFVYLRRSQDREDRQQLSIEKQDRQVKQIITENNFTPINLPAEERSARTPGRPIFNDMMTKIESGETRYIAVWNLSRLSRNSIDGGRLIYALDMGKLLAIYTPTRVYRNTPDDKAFLAIELAFAKKNNDDLSEQVRESFVEKRNHGEYPGPAPIGYLNIIVRPGVRNIAPDPEKAPKIIHLFNMASTGRFTVHDLWLEAQNIGLRSRTGRVLSKQTLIDTFKRRMYTGVFKYGTPEWHQGSYEPLISPELYDQVQVALGWAKKREAPSTTSGRFYPYKGLLMCGACKFNITAYTKAKKLADGSIKEYEFYTCTKKNKTLTCAEPQVSDRVLAQEIATEIGKFEIGEDDAKQCLSYLRTFYDEYVGQRNRYRDVWKRELSEAQKALNTLDEKLETGVISDERYKTRRSVHETTVARTSKLLTSTSNDAEKWLELASEVFSGAVNIGQVFELANAQERREIMKYIGSNWFLTNKKVVLTPRKPLHLLHVSCRNQFWRARPDSNRRSSP